MMTFLPFTQSRGYRTAAFVHRSALFVWLVKTAELIPSSANSLQYLFACINRLAARSLFLDCARLRQLEGNF